MATKTIAFFLSLFFVIGDAFMAAFPQNRLEIRKADNAVPFYVNGKNEEKTLSYGVASERNLFEPGEEIRVVIDNRAQALYGTRAKVAVFSKQAGFDKVGYFVFEKEDAQYTFRFSSARNGIFTVTLKTVENREYSFCIGVMPKNEIAGDRFYYGVQPYITRAKAWDVNNRIPGFDADESVDRILDAAAYLGVNLIRENGMDWGSMQAGPYADVTFDVQDGLIAKANAKGMKYNWILGTVTTRWGLNERYKNVDAVPNLWAYPPEESMWNDYITKLADHYRQNGMILYEIWNEPDWEFFAGTKEEYFTILENTAKILKAANPDAYVYTGGLAFAWRDEAFPFYQKSNELMRKGLLDNWGYHNHDSNANYAKNVRATVALAKAAGLTCGGINSESGIVGADASLIARKALFTRSTGSDGYVSFSFRKTVNDPSDVSDYAFFDEYLQPGEAVLTFGTVIRFLGNADYIGNRSEKKNIIMDEYKTADGTILACYSFGETKRIKMPGNVCACYDMYGNPIAFGKRLRITEAPVYLLLDR